MKDEIAADWVVGWLASASAEFGGGGCQGVGHAISTIWRLSLPSTIFCTPQHDYIVSWK